MSSGFWSSPRPKLASHWLNRERSTAGSARGSPVDEPGSDSSGVPPAGCADGSGPECWFMLFEVRVSARGARGSCGGVFKDDAAKTRVPDGGVLDRMS